MAAAVCAPGFAADPYPTWRAWQAAAPVHWSTEFLGGAWVVTRYADVQMVLRDPRFAARRTGAWLAAEPDKEARHARFRQLFARAMLFLDEPDHARVRRALQQAFSPAAMRELSGHAEREAGALCDDVAGMERFDFMARVARPLPARVIARWMGLEDIRQDTFMAWSEALATFIGAMQPTRTQMQDAQDSLIAMAGALEGVLDERRHHPRDDLVGALLKAEAEGLLQAGPEVVAQCAMLLFGGYETTRNLLGNGLNALLRDRAQWLRLQAEPTLLPSAVRELLRFDTPVQYTARRVTTDLVLHGTRLRRGDAVMVVIAAANRDPQVFSNPDVLDVGRRGGSGVSFGSGAHVCIGAALTQIEAQAVFRTLLQRYPALALDDAPGVAPRHPDWVANSVYRGLASLPLRNSGETPRNEVVRP